MSEVRTPQWTMGPGASRRPCSRGRGRPADVPGPGLPGERGQRRTTEVGSPQSPDAAGHIRLVRREPRQHAAAASGRDECHARDVRRRHGRTRHAELAGEDGRGPDDVAVSARDQRSGGLEDANARRPSPPRERQR
jgi:hypothetical protein